MGALDSCYRNVDRRRLQELGMGDYLHLVFTVGEAVRSTCGNSHEEKDEEKEENNRFHLSLHQTIL